jgi:hypothetical protein
MNPQAAGLAAVALVGGTMSMSCTRLWVAVFLVVAWCSVQTRAQDAGLNFGAEEIVQADGSDLVVTGYSVPSMEDWNNDGLGDLIVGEGGGTTPGRVRVYLNVGTESNPRFSKFFYVQAGGQDLTCAPQGCMGCFPRVVQWDGDNRKDLLVGLADGTVRIYLNVADDNSPAFDAGQFVTVGDPASSLDVGSRATPILVDWNDDGMLDIVSGGLDSLIHIYYNCGCDGPVPPHFFASAPAGAFAQENGHDLQVPGVRSSPVFMDLDGDGLKDLLTGNTDGQILFYKNTGVEAFPMFSGYSLVKSNGKPIDLAGTLRSRPFVCHWTGNGRFGPKDGYSDLLVGYGDGKVHLYRGIPKRGDFDGDGTLGANDFTLLCAALDQPVPAQGSVIDLNGDGVVDNADLRIFADLWLVEHKPTDLPPPAQPDVTPPQPNPMTWDTVDDPAVPVVGWGGQPIAITTDQGVTYSARMTAIAATDASGTVEYYFACMRGSSEDSRFSSGWTAKRTYQVVTGPHPGAFGFSFKVKARDAAHNETGWSSQISPPQ